MKRLLTPLLALLLGVASAAGANDVRQLEWDDLMPEDWDPFAAIEALQASNPDALVDNSPEAQAAYEAFLNAGRSAPVVGTLDGERVRLPGFVLPLEFENKQLKEFLLVPYFGACIHVPPPPSNQVVFVKVDEPHAMKQMFEPVWVTGTIRTEAHLNDLGDAGYTTQASGIEPYRQVAREK